MYFCKQVNHCVISYFSKIDPCGVKLSKGQRVKEPKDLIPEAAYRETASLIEAVPVSDTIVVIQVAQPSVGCIVL